VATLTIEPELFRERARPGGQPLKLRYYALLLPPIAHWCIAGLDVGRFHWSDSVPLALQIAGLAIFASGLALIIWAVQALMKNATVATSEVGAPETPQYRIA
jgi:hypothetical protein